MLGLGIHSNPVSLSGCVGHGPGNLARNGLDPTKSSRTRESLINCGSSGGKEMVVHHNNLKPCVLPAGKGVTFCPSPELTDITVLQGEAIPPQAQGIGPAGGPNHRPARLRRTINPPLRFGEYVTH